MTAKEKAVQYIQSLPDDVALGEIVERLRVIQKIEKGIAQADAGELTDHDEFFDELEADDAA